jgi:hypothetical protein
MKKRILVTISFSFSIRYLVRTGLLKQLQEFSEPVIGIFWDQKDLIEELKSQGFEVHILPNSERGIAYTNIRAKLDYWFKYFKLKSPTRDIEPRYLEQFHKTKSVIIRRLREYYNYILCLIPGHINKLHQQEQALLKIDTNYLAMLHLVENLNIDAVFVVTPFHAQEDVFLRACEAAGKQMITSILSFDNIVKRGWIPVNYSTYMVWNQKMKKELLRIYAPNATESNIHIVGAAQFDFYKKPEFVLPREEWLKIVGLPDTDRKIILFAGGPLSLFPQEHQFLQHIDKAITNGSIKGNPIILFRCHPIDKIERWKNAVKGSGNVFFDTSWTGAAKLTLTNVTNYDIKKLCSTLLYTDVHVNTCSTMTVDGSAFKKPQIGPAYDEFVQPRKYDLKSMYYQEYFLPIMKTNGVLHANNRKELIQFVNDALANPKNYISKSEDILKAIITYTDGKCTDRVVEVLKKSL